MHFFRLHPFFFTAIALLLLAAVSPCPANTLTIADKTTDLHLTTMPDITVGLIAYKGPTLSDIGMKPISYQGPLLSDITVGAIQYSGHIFAVAPASPKVSPKASKIPLAITPQRIAGVAPKLEILSPKPGQRFTGSVPLEVKITGWNGLPRVQFSWWWSADTSPGQWPATPQGIAVVDSIVGKSRIVIPRSAFPHAGTWRVRAMIPLSDMNRVVDDVYFSVSDKRVQTVKPAIKRAGPMPVAPGSTAAELSPSDKPRTKAVTSGTTIKQVE